MQRMAFEAAIHRGGVGVKESIAAFGAGFAAAEGEPVPVEGRAARRHAHLSRAGAADGRGRQSMPSRRGRSSAPASSGWPTTRTSPTRANISTRLKPIAEARPATRQRLGPPAGRDRARACARHGLRGHRARRRIEDPPEPLRARARRGAGRRRPDRRDRRIPASARAGDRRHAAGGPRPLAAEHRLAAALRRALHQGWPRGEDLDHPRLPAALFHRLTEADAAALAALRQRAEIPERMAADDRRRRRDELCARHRNRDDAHAGEGLQRHPRARPARATTR